MKTKLLFSLFVLILILLAFASLPDTYAQKILDDAFHRTFVAFGLAKGLNALISMLQGTQLSLMPAGVGVSLSVGEVLDPFNDLVERFSWVMLLATVSLGIQKIFLAFGAKLFLKVALALSGAVAILLFWKRQYRKSRLFEIAIKTFLLLLILRFFAVLFLFLSQFFYMTMLEEEYAHATQNIEMTKSHIEKFQKESQADIPMKENGISQYLSSKYDQIKESLDIDKKFDKLQKNIDAGYSSIIDLITLFIVQSVILPLLFLWIFITAIKRIFIKNFAFFNKNIIHDSI